MTNDNAERFERLIAALARELIEATDEEVLEAARDLRMNPAMKGSAAFFGLTTAHGMPFRPDDPPPSAAGAPGARRRSKRDPSQ